MKTLFFNLRQKLKAEGRSLIWFHREYLADITYNAMYLQLNGNAAKISDKVRRAANRYLEEK